MPKPSPWQAGGPWEESQLPGPAGRVSPSPCPAAQPCPGLPGSEHMATARGHQGLAQPSGDPSPAGGMGGLGGCLPAAPWRGLHWSRHRLAGTARVGLITRFESVQEAAYQRSCCLCRFLSLLLPHPACRPHTYRPHLCSSALLGQPAPALLPTSEPPSGTCRCSPTPPRHLHALPGHLQQGWRGVLSVLCNRPRPVPVPAHGARRDLSRPGHGAGATGRWVGVGCFMWSCSGDTRPHLPHREPGGVLLPLSHWPYALAQAVCQLFPSCCRVSQGTSHPQRPSMHTVVLMPPYPRPCGCHLPPLCTQDHPWARRGRMRGLASSTAEQGRRCVRSGRSLEGLAQVGQAYPWDIAHPSCRCPLPQPCALPVCNCPGSAQTLQASFLFCLHPAALPPPPATMDPASQTPSPPSCSAGSREPLALGFTSSSACWGDLGCLWDLR